MPEYTRGDMETLAKVSVPGSVPSVFLSELDYDPERFKKFLGERGMKEELHYLYELPLDEVVPLMDDEPKIGYLKFRAEVGK